jgi:excisionase family DNA binding protein
MASQTPEMNFESAPTQTDVLLAQESSRLLVRHKLGRRSTVHMQFLDDAEEATEVEVPVSAIRLFLQVFAEMSRGNAVTLISAHAELTRKQAADLLNVSLRYLVKLLDEGLIPCRTEGKFRRVHGLKSR